MKKARIKVKQKIGAFGIIAFAVITIYCITILSVLIWAFMNSFKAQFDFLGLGGLLEPNYFGFPRGPFSEKYGGWHFENYLTAFKSVSIRVGVEMFTLDEMFLNSVLYTSCMSVFGVLTPLIVAYCCAKYEFKLKAIIYTTAIIVMMIPIVGSLSSELLIQRQLHLENLIGVCIIKNKYTGLYFLVFYGTYKSISTTYMEAARIDGAGEFTIFFRIMLTLGKSAIFSIMILLFINHWNDYYTPMMFLPFMPTVARGLQYVTSAPIAQLSSHIPVKLCASIMVALPTLVLFLTFRKQIMGSIAIGGIKG